MQRVPERLPKVPVEVRVDKRIERRVEVADPEQHRDYHVRAGAGLLAAQARDDVPGERGNKKKKIANLMEEERVKQFELNQLSRWDRITIKGLRFSFVSTRAQASHLKTALSIN